ncbi:DNA cytosine methyltransferase [[Pseudomonas] boreopolis]|uniref:DNA (cytosine-5-)-methyltransferase n=1 Tax=Xanthomonas boreopolis TaxID=86183 RepID=A0A919F7L2_9XANT|nr:cytosine-specific methyltransferase [[Pseudomonas] boreopolis]
MRYLSLFSGMEAAHLAWAPLGWECAAVAEIEPAACALLRHRLPHVPNLGDVSMISTEQIAALGRLDVVIGGSPCQDLSVAGKRAGLAGARSGLFHEQLRIFNAARTLCGARWLVWENVPGAFSSNKGCDFAVVVGALAGCRVDVPADGWGNEGVALGDNGLVEWAVLDAQWFGVAQRRRRVFAVLDTGDWAGRPPVLLEPESLRGDSAPRREAGEGVANSLVGRPDRGGGNSEGQRLIPEVAPTLLAQGNRTGGDRPPGTSVDTCESLIPEIARCVTTGEAKRQDWETCTIIPAVAHTLRADGFDASEDGTGRGTPLVPVTAFGCKDSDPARSISTDVAPTLRAMGHAGSHANAGGQVAVAVSLRGREGGGTAELGDEVGNTLRASQGGGDKPHVLAGMQVRRLTPRECERLQGAPDDWTLVPKLGKPRRQRKNEPDAHYAAYLERHSGGVDLGPMMADGPRYKMLGNSFAVPVIRWIGEQIHQAQACERSVREAA